MAVFTDVTDEQVCDFLLDYDIGNLVTCRGIADGTQNSNFMIVTSDTKNAGTYILTLYDKGVKQEDLPFFLGLMDYLKLRGLPVAEAIPQLSGSVLGSLAGKPAVILSFVRGMWPRKVTPEHCFEAGRILAKIHLNTQNFSLNRTNALSIDRWLDIWKQCQSHRLLFPDGLYTDVVQDDLEFLNQRWHSTIQSLPKGVIHADLFPDNVFYLTQNQKPMVSGIIDFYYACYDVLAYDLGITVNAWCFERDGAFNITKSKALLKGYCTERPLLDAEWENLPLLCRAGAMPYMLTRLRDWVFPSPASVGKPRNPMDFYNRLQFHSHTLGLGSYGWEEVRSEFGDAKSDKTKRVYG